MYNIFIIRLFLQLSILCFFCNPLHITKNTVMQKLYPLLFATYVLDNFEITETDLRK